MKAQQLSHKQEIVLQYCQASGPKQLFLPLGIASNLQKYVIIINQDPTYIVIISAMWQKICLP